jgi:anaerobic selenocysteine-containing dehydrogenase
MGHVVHRACTLCEACCGIEIHVDGGRISAIRGDTRDPLSRGYICAKAAALKDLHEDPDRLRQPVKRTGRGWQTCGWEEALAYAVEGILAVQREHGPDAAAIYHGEPLVHNLGALLFVDELVGALGTRKRFTANSLDQIPKQLVCHWMYGSGFFVPVPDVDRTQHLLIFGANPLVSNGSLLTAPGMRRRLREIRARGGRVVVVDPRRSETAEAADEHHFIRPGCDPLLLAALVNTILTDERARMERLAGFSVGLGDVARFASDFTPERVAARVGIEPAVIRRIARNFAEAPSAACYGRIGTSTVPFGTTANWLIEVLNAITGNLDRPGGAMFPKPPVDVMALQPRTQRGRWRSRTRGTPEFMGELPTATLAEEIVTPGEGRVRALVTLAGNPVLSSPAGDALGAALRKLDFMVSIDLYRNETTRHANVILPPVGPLEREHFDVAFQLFAVRNVPRWSPAVFNPPPEAHSDGAILLELSSRLPWARRSARRLRALWPRVLLALGAERSARLALDLALRTGPHGSGLRPWGSGLTLARLRRSDHGIDLGPMQPGLPERLPAEAKTINLAPRQILADRERLRAYLEASAPALMLIGRREARSVNSWSHNLTRLVKGRARCVLEMHPADAEARGIASGMRVRVRSRGGAVEVPVQVCDSVMPGVVSLPHGYGHLGEGLQLGVAVERAGVSFNDLTDPAEIDPLSGNAVLSGVPVRVEVAEGEWAPRGRSG